MKTRNIIILAIDDSKDDQTLITRAFRLNKVNCAINWAGSGEEAIAYLKGDGQFSDRARFPYPTFIMTDLKMPNGECPPTARASWERDSCTRVTMKWPNHKGCVDCGVDVMG